MATQGNSSSTRRPASAAGATDGRASAAQAVYDRLLQAINSGRFRPGDRILEAEVAQWLMVSRTPVREALRWLESEDVLVRGTQGLTVAAMDDDEVLELYELRESLDALAAQYAAQRATAGDRRELQRLLEQEAKLAPDDVAGLAAVNRNLHVAIAAAAHNRYLSKTLAAMQDVFLRLPSTTFSVRGRPGQALAEHRLIVEAILAGDASSAARHARGHIQASRRMRLRMNQAMRDALRDEEGLGKPPRALRSPPGTPTTAATTARTPRTART